VKGSKIHGLVPSTDEAGRVEAGGAANRDGRDDREFVQSLARGLDVLQAFNRDHPRMTLSEVAARVGLSRATSRRLLLTLAQLGHIGSDGKHFWLRARVLDLGYRYLASQPWWHAAQPLMERAASALNETCSIGALDGTDVVYLTGVAPARIASIDLHPGLRVPAYCASSGRVILAGCPDKQIEAVLDASTIRQLTPRTTTDRMKLLSTIQKVRAQGFSLVDGEFESDIRSLAVAINDRSKRPIAAINVTCLASRMTASDMVSRCLPILRDAAQGIGRESAR
jgi:IclR family transcriptional regulator, pca regulon regulatory protein